ncbi:MULTISPECIES: ferric reductase-like transmembrane domain-containing protein [unclassified Lentimicrobium]|uniref:ferric reductase-like transmembrane domain-containing protein n=1 Tax=unclassified Lentimicrobium TaxID=2677434 RepID=UPI0015542954|nr:MULTISPECIES: ferric reductase-like transmembrane domain-containing protein [unclassified Lentimicrobium]NPD44051.1 FAD/NAD(P)-binding:oxidoreductase [Lentimicrobium sp. S6]NPD85903.1 FAD/NAD(P)-binding:oxidoreductase [Lentimicrobium sp. L6]
MENRIKIYNQIAAVAVFIVLPILIYSLGDFPRRSLLKEAISLVTILAFSMMLMQFFLSRANKPILKEHHMAKVIKWHKALGYVFVSVLLLHPFLIVLPRYFEAGISPNRAFLELLSNINQQGLLLGLTAWILMLIIGLTSLFRYKLRLTYLTWRMIHGYLSIAFIIAASLHVLSMGRHMNKPMSWLFILLSLSAMILLMKTYFFKSTSQKNNNHV